MISLEISKVHSIEKIKITQTLIELSEITKSKGGDPMKFLRLLSTIIVKNPSHSTINNIIEKAKTK
jgi:hypothetical protein